VTPLSNGNYVVSSPNWDNGSVAIAGAVTWGNGTGGVSGAVSALNSLVGSTADDEVGSWGVTPLSNGNYVVGSPYWDNGAVMDAGAVTWGNGTGGVSGVVSALNSLVGSTVGDSVGYGCYLSMGCIEGVTPLSNGSYGVKSPTWDNGAVTDSGAVTWGNGESGTIGPITADNSVRGATASGGVRMIFQYDTVNNQLVVGRPADNIVTLFRLSYVFPLHVFLPVVSK
jgi:hypothetical protein